MAIKRNQVLKLIRSQKAVLDKATVHSIDGDTVGIVIGSSRNVIRNVEVIGGTGNIIVGREVNIMWIDDRPVVVGNAAGLVGPTGAVGPQGPQGEKGDTGDVGPQGPAGGMSLPGGRLTLESGTPVTQADKSNIGTLLYTPYISDQIPLHDGTAWNTYSFTETSLSLAGSAAGYVYDVFGVLSGGVLTLEKLAWTNTTARATQLAYSNGHLVKNGDPTRLYLGTFYCSSAGTTTDAERYRYLWNMYNRAPRRVKCNNTTTHTYSGSLRKWNNSDTDNLVAFVIGLAEYVGFSLNMVWKSGSAGTYAITRVYVDGGTESGNASDQMQNYTGQYLQVGNSFVRNLGVGRHYAQVYEWSNSASSEFYAFTIDFNLMA